MTKYEELMANYENLYIEERPMKNDGLYADGCVWINRNMPEHQRYCILAEEIGHYETTVGNILDQTPIENQRQEIRARRWAYNRLLPLNDIINAIKDGHTEIWDIAEYLNVNEAFLKGALSYYGMLT